MDHLHPALLAVLIILLPIAAAGCAAGRRHATLGLASDRLVQLLLAGVALLGVGGLFLPERTLYLASVAVGGVDHAIAAGIRADRLGLVMAAFIAAIGLVVHRYARGYLIGDPRRAGFLAGLAVVIAAALAQALSPGLVQFALGWIMASLGLQRMLRHQATAPAALAASTKFLVSRLGDLAMATAIIALLVGAGTTDFAGLTQVAATAQPGLLLVAGLAAVLAVACKSALAPFQAWLIGTVEAPTPLSALMHAGVVNAGGFLVLRLSPLFAQAPGALDLLLLLGLVSALIGPLAMWAQTDLKRSLAWSTVGQMGFMAVQCGLGAFGAAFLHLIGHGCYKADAFLRSGTLVRAVESRPPAGSTGRALAFWALGVVVSAVVLALTYRALGTSLAELHGGLALLVVQALAMSQLVATPTARGTSLLGRLVILIPGCVIYAALALAAEAAIAGSVAVIAGPASRPGFAPILAVLVPLALAALGAFWVLMPALARHPRVLAARVHAAHGFYLPHLSQRVVCACLPRHARTISTERLP